MLNSRDLIGMSDDQINSYIGKEIWTTFRKAGRLTKLSNGDWGVKVTLPCCRPGCHSRDVVYLVSDGAMPDRYACDQSGHRLTDLPNEAFVCEKHSPPRPGQTKKKRSYPCKPLPTLTQEDLERLWGQVKESEDYDACWWWQGKGRPVGTVSIGGVTYRVQRIVYAINHGDPGERRVYPSCGVHRCCNPRHLGLWGGEK